MTYTSPLRIAGESSFGNNGHIHIPETNELLSKNISFARVYISPTKDSSVSIALPYLIHRQENKNLIITSICSMKEGILTSQSSQNLIHLHETNNYKQIQYALNDRATTEMKEKKSNHGRKLLTTDCFSYNTKVWNV